MNILSFFSKRAKISGLQSFINSIDPGSFPSTYKKIDNDNLKLPTVLAMHTLFSSNKLFNSILKISKPATKVDKDIVRKIENSYDAIIFETAAFSLFWMGKDYLLPKNDDFEDYTYKDFEEDNYWETINSTMHIVGGLICKYNNIDNCSKIFANRNLHYGRYMTNRESNSCFIDFERLLIVSIMSGVPVIKPDTFVLGGLGLEVSVPASIKSYTQTYLHALEKAFTGLYSSHIKGELN